MTISADAAILQILDWVDNDNPMDDSGNDDDDLDDLYRETIIVRVPDGQSDVEDTNRKNDTDSSDEDVSPLQQQTPVRRRHPKKTLTSNRLVNLYVNQEDDDNNTNNPLLFPKLGDKRKLCSACSDDIAGPANKQKWASFPSNKTHCQKCGVSFCPSHLTYVCTKHIS